MEVYVRDYKGRRFTIKCEADDDIGVLLQQYSALCNDSIDENVFNYVVQGVGEVGEGTMLSDLGICHESSVKIGLQKRLVEFKVVDFNAIICGTSPPGVVTARGEPRGEEDEVWWDAKVALFRKYGRTPEEKTFLDDPKMKSMFMAERKNYISSRILPDWIYPHLLSEEVNSGWEIVDINYQWRGSGCTVDCYPKVIFKRVI